MKKVLAVTIMILFISICVIPSSGIFIKNKSTFVTEIDTIPSFLKSSMSKKITLEKSYKLTIKQDDSIIIFDTEYDDFHPTLAGDIKQRFFACFERTWNDFDYYPDFWYSLDNGMTWEEAGYFSESLGGEYPDADSNDNAFYATFSVNWINDQLWLIYAEDLPNIFGNIIIGEWSPNYFQSIMHPAISCYTRENESWNFGGIAFTCDYGYSGDIEGLPVIYYPTNDYAGVVSWIPELVDYFHSDFAIDEITEMSYAVWDNEVDANLLVRKDNFGEWNAQERHPYIGAWSVGEGTNLSNPSIEAHNDIIIIVTEEAGDIVCFYSNNGFSSQSKTTVVSSAMSPEVKVTFDGEIFACSYVKNGAVYVKKSTDGGATWVNEEQVQDSQAVSEFGSHDLGKGTDGIYSVWEDTRGGDRDIYFGQAYKVTNPELEIKSIKGPIGITATIKNIGDEEATNVEWTLKVTGGILGLINIEKSGTLPILEIDEDLFAKSGIIFGLGKITVIVTVKFGEGLSDKEIVSGTQILFFTLI